MIHPDQFLGLAPAEPADALALILPVPFERTVSYGTGTWRAPRAIIDASCQVEVFDEETGVDFETDLKFRTEPSVISDESETPQAFLERLAAVVRGLRESRGGRVPFLMGLGGEHLVTYGLLDGLVPDLEGLTVVQIDAHADLALELGGERWSHGSVMRRLLERGVKLVSVGVRSLSREEHEFAAASDAVSMYYAHDLTERWGELAEEIARLRGPIYLTIDCDGLDPAVIPGVGTPQPDGLSWRQAIRLIAMACGGPDREVIGADVVEFVASPHPPGCDLIVAKLVAKVLAFWHVGREREKPRAASPGAKRAAAPAPAGRPGLGRQRR